MVEKIGDGVLVPDSDGLINILGVLTELKLESSLDFVFPPDILEDPVACSNHCVITLDNDNVDIINDPVFGRVVERPYTVEPRTT